MTDQNGRAASAYEGTQPVCVVLALLFPRRFAGQLNPSMTGVTRLDWTKLRTKLLELLQSIWEDSQEKVLIFTSLSSTRFMFKYQYHVVMAKYPDLELEL